ncbi:hypothetical protein GCM10027594_04920 [Hymenobacter agri]
MGSQVNFIIVQPQLSREAFLQSLAESFPEIAEEVLDEDYAGLIHLQVGAMARYGNRLIQTGRFDELQKLFDFFHHTVTKVDSNTENALYVSFLEHIDMAGESEKAKQARSILPAGYLSTWQALWEGRYE